MVHDLNTACLEFGEGGRVGDIHRGTCAKIFVAVIKLANRSLGPHNLKVLFPVCSIRLLPSILETLGKSFG